ncbi:piggyBac transposable element-derived protein 2-like [Ornithodoros turicata]|uniref:piggyBac transposable element-derived protein 2-like n=1 Tax=Ornithodoros turicata TaxID=34597 RepID=UPI003138966C
MRRDRFFELRNVVHFADIQNVPENQKQNKLYRLQPILSSFRSGSVSLPRFSNLSVDEQMIPFVGRCPARQYIPSKPNPVGLKNFVLATPQGLMLDFKIYTGKDTVDQETQKELGLGGAIVKLLLQTVPSDKTVHMLKDRYFIGLKLAEFLRSRNTHLTGTVLSTRTGGAAQKLPDDKQMKRGDSACVVGADGKGTCKCWSSDANGKVDVPQPAAVKQYNSNMGGVNLIDCFMAFYRIKIRTKKWTVRVYAHFLDLAVCNGWIQYKQDCAAHRMLKKDILDLLEFKVTIA